MYWFLFCIYLLEEINILIPEQYTLELLLNFFVIHLKTIFLMHSKQWILKILASYQMRLEKDLSYSICKEIALRCLRLYTQKSPPHLSLIAALLYVLSVGMLQSFACRWWSAMKIWESKSMLYPWRNAVNCMLQHHNALCQNDSASAFDLHARCYLVQVMRIHEQCSSFLM